VTPRTPEPRGSHAPPVSQTIANVDWYGQARSRESYERVLFTDIDLTEATMEGMSFSECTFRRIQFNCSIHREGAFVNCTFANCSFFETVFEDCKLLGSTFDSCTFDLMRVRGGNWSMAGLPSADLRKATFEDVRLREADLTGARLQGAVVRGCDLSAASLAGAVLNDCDLRGSDLAGIEPDSIALRGAVITVDQAVTIIEAMGLEVRE
jgi:uncharacterized protein YjbI with pentapeptide repeats